MEPVTHALTSIALGRAGLNKITSMATPLLLVSGLVADVDWITRLGGASAFLRGHRTATHSFAGTVFLILMVAGAFWFAGKKYPKLAVEYFPAILVCAAGATSHLVLDMLNETGVRLFWPFCAKWFAWDIANSVDGWIIFFLLAGLLVPELFKLIHEEIGARSKRNSRQRGARVGLTLAALFIGGRGVAHGRAIALLDSRVYRTETPLSVGAFPKPSNPFAWSGVVETDDATFNMEVPVAVGKPFDPDLADAHFKPEPSATLNNAIASATAVEFLDYARFPLANVEPHGDGYEVRFRDMRYASELQGSRGIVAVIDLNAQNLVISERLEFDGDTPRQAPN